MESTNQGWRVALYYNKERTINHRATPPLPLPFHICIDLNVLLIRGLRDVPKLKMTYPAQGG
jgi:hypothetical protein